MPQTAIVIPARMDSHRLPGKPMLMAGGKPLVHWTYDRARRTNADRVIVATPDEEIMVYCFQNGLRCDLTDPEHPTGTLRCIELVENIQWPDVVVCWQVDEPLVDPAWVDKMIRLAIDEPDQIVTPVAPADDIQLANPNVTKVAVSGGGWIHWFSRAPMGGTLLHCGVYVFNRRLTPLIKLADTTEMSRAESLEQTAWLEAGLTMRALRMDRLPLSINTPDDWEEFKRIIEGEEG